MIEVLNSYQQTLQIAKMLNPAIISSPKLNGMPRAVTYQNTQEQRMAVYLAKKEELTAIQRVVGTYLDHEEQMIVYYLYLCNEKVRKTKKELISDMYLSRRTFYRIYDKALMKFADNYHFNGIELRVFNLESGLI
ncbi:MAG: hypothetical protein H9901_00845 [Candidatus Paralactobacillus gallistercoris]|uniref:Phage transcriptional regulator, ArpU family n=1 Tax=Candidatus Paralactobacillus gallistercoris TaxID=2838724 RepID=A0A948WZ69_9LACO|nr:hypothetical protein [Candidatus Paralactobacillus gallistercoris]